MNQSKIFNIASVMAIIVLSLFLGKTCNKLNNTEANIKALTDTLTVYKDKDGNQVARIASFEADKLSDLLKIQSSDSSVKRLQETIKRYEKASSVVVVNNETKVNTTSPTIITKSDTINNFIYPTYQSHVKLGKWVDVLSLAGKDSTHIDLTIYNEYDVVLKREKGILNSYVINHNPYTSTTMQRAASTSAPRTKHFGIGPSAGVTWYNKKPQPYIGIGVHYNLIKF